MPTCTQKRNVVTQIYRCNDSTPGGQSGAHAYNHASKAWVNLPMHASISQVRGNQGHTRTKLGRDVHGFNDRFVQYSIRQQGSIHHSLCPTIVHNFNDRFVQYSTISDAGALQTLKSASCIWHIRIGIRNLDACFHCAVLPLRCALGETLLPSSF